MEFNIILKRNYGFSKELSINVEIDPFFTNQDL